MVYLEIYEDFERAAERLYLNAPMKLTLECIQFKTDSQQELKKIEKLMSSLIKHMASNSEDK
ncbi:Signal recognition particle protein [Armadillidium nasatum]|uniref:Signal recognition particle protein n=1 Tax=Armadillidium nasatum TaxID=96803 RepID=A0A5N5SI00_9CRUS|nr:Signal recognition particle protein [Armadillidium nasatum]